MISFSTKVLRNNNGAKVQRDNGAMVQWCNGAMIQGEQEKKYITMCFLCGS